MTKENQTKQPVVAEATVSVAMTDGRSAFETFVKTSTSQNIARDQNGFYTDEVTYDWWKVWQAAILSRAQDAQAVRNAALREAAQYIKDMGEPLFIEEGILDLQSAPAQPVEIPDAVELPPLPPRARLTIGELQHTPVFTADQMREYALAALSQVRGKAQEPVAWTHPERLAKVAAGKVDTMWNEVHVLDGDIPLYAAAPQSDAQQSEKDAERYRWLRHADLDALAAANWGDGEVYTGEAFDAAIDAALAKEQGR